MIQISFVEGKLVRDINFYHQCVDRSKAAKMFNGLLNITCEQEIQPLSNLMVQKPAKLLSFVSGVRPELKYWRMYVNRNG